MKQVTSITINELIKMEPRSHDIASEEGSYISFGVLSEVFETAPEYADNSNLSEEMEQRVEHKDFMLDWCNDGRSRTLEVIFVDKKPVIIWQYIGKGYIENVKVIDKDLLEELRLDIMRNEEETAEYIGLDEEYEVMNYNTATTALLDNQLVAAFHGE